MDCSPSRSSVHGISQARILDWVAISVSRDFPDPGIKPESPPLAGGFFTTEAPGKPKAIILPMGEKKRRKKEKKKTGEKGGSNFHSSHLTSVSWASLNEVMITVLDASPRMALFTCSCGP